MGVLALLTDELADDYRGKPTNDHGKLRFQYFNLPAVAVAGDIASTIDLCKLPSGNVRVVPGLSMMNCSAWGAARTLDIGHRAYKNRDSDVEALTAENSTAFAAAIDTSAAIVGESIGQTTKFDLYSKSGVTIFGTVAGGTIPIGATLSGYIAYLTE